MDPPTQKTESLALACDRNKKIGEKVYNMHFGSGECRLGNLVIYERELSRFITLNIYMVNRLQLNPVTRFITRKAKTAS